LESYLFGVSQKYLGMLGVGLSSGTRFSDEDARLGAESILVNESFVSQAGLVEPIGKYILIDSTEYAIAGVLKDFHSEDLFSFIEPSIFRLSEDEDIKFVTMTVQAGTGIASASSIQERYKQAFEGREPIYYFQNQAFEGFLEESKGITNIFSFIALLSLLISCLSIYALSSQNVANRMKEIGVRKVLGGSPASIAQLVNRRLFFFMTAAAVVAGPLAYYGLDALLDDMYAYRMDLNALPFILTYLLIIATTALTISSQTRGIRNARPADIMRIE
ncbi:MAG: FtsX-like permease family protein, partial [Bacteroidetes bacterium]